MNDIRIVEKILRSLTPNYDYVVCSVKKSKDIDELSLDELQSSLLEHEQKMNRNSTFDEQTLKASTFISSNFRGRRRGRGRGRGRGDRGNRDGGIKYDKGNFRANDDYDKGKGRAFEKSKIECYPCHNLAIIVLNVVQGCLMRWKKKQILLRMRKEKPCNGGSY